MPYYDYECLNGHHTEELVKYDDRDSVGPCPICGEARSRVPHRVVVGKEGYQFALYTDKGDIPGALHAKGNRKRRRRF